MKLFWNKKYFTISLYTLVTFSILILFSHVLDKIQGVYGYFSAIINILRPMIFAFVISYLLNPILKKTELFLDKTINKKKNMTKYLRSISILITYIIGCVIIYLLALVILPKIVDSISTIISVAPTYFEKITQFADFLINKLNLPLNSINEQYGNLLNNDALMEKALNFLNSLLPQIATFTSKISGAIFDIILGLIVSIYILISKEKFFAHAKKILFAIFKVKTAKQIIDAGHYANNTFNGFLIGKILDSLIIGILCFVGMSIFRLPFAMLISVVVGVTNIIPYFGPFIGAIPSIILILLVDPIKAFWFGIFILVLQQIDGNIIGPRILGDKTGLSSFWVVFAILLSGGLFGFVGMVVGVPIFAIIYTCIRVLVEQKLKDKNLPVETDCYTCYKYPENIETDTKEK